jgi:hypothetical protein
MKKSIQYMLFGLMLCMAGSLAAAPLGSAFTYQGQLNDGGSPANGYYDLRLALYNAPSFGTLIAGPVVNSFVLVSNGLFTTEVDFGSGVFDGTAYWMEMEVRPAGGGIYTLLTPRQTITATPYALHAVTADLAGGVVGGVDDADADPANELNISMVFAANILELTDAAGTLSVSLASLVNDADPDPTNELNNSMVLNGTILEVTDAGGTLSEDLSPLIDDDDWAYFSGSGLSGSIYHSGDVALGEYTDPDGHGLNVQNYESAHAAVRAVDGYGINVFAEGMLGVLTPGSAPINFPFGIVNAGVMGIKPASGSNGAGVIGWNTDDNLINYASIFLAEGSNSFQNIAVYAEAKNGADNIAGLFKGDLVVENDYLEVTGLAGERAYIGGDGAGNDVQIGSLNSNVTTVATWNPETSTRMDFIASNIWATGDANVFGTAAVSEDAWISGSAIVKGQLRVGTETNAAPPNYPLGSEGLIIRRVASTTSSTSNVVARSELMKLERDGTFAGLQVSWSAGIGDAVINATGITESGTLVAFHHHISYPGTAGSVTVFSGAQVVSHYDISFGDPYASTFGHITHVQLERSDGDYFMIGTVTSTYNQ